MDITTVYVTTVVSSEVGHVTIFQRSGTCVCGEGTSRIFGPKATSAVMLKEITHLRHVFENIVNNFHNTVFSFSFQKH